MIIFVHIPKCGGTSFHKLTQTGAYGVPADDWPLLSLNASFLDRVPYLRNREPRVFSGHVPLGLHRHVKWPCQYVTTLREPVGRCSSYYLNNLRNCDLALREAPSLARAIEETRPQSMCNYATRLLLGNRDDPDASSWGDAEAAEAFERLRTFALVGFTPELNKFLVQACKLLNLEVPKELPHLNIGGKEDPFSNEVKTVLREFNRADAKLYELAWNHFR